MRQHAIAVVVVICLGIVLTAGLSAQNADSKAVSDKTPAWQHLALTHDTERGIMSQDLGRQINKLGREGWELIEVATYTKDGTTDKAVYYFKRALP